MPDTTETDLVTQISQLQMAQLKAAQTPEDLLKALDQQAGVDVSTGRLSPARFIDIQDREAEAMGSKSDVLRDADAEMSPQVHDLSTRVYAAATSDADLQDRATILAELRGSSRDLAGRLEQAKADGEQRLLDGAREIIDRRAESGTVDPDVIAVARDQLETLQTRLDEARDHPPSSPLSPQDAEAISRLDGVHNPVDMLDQLHRQEDPQYRPDPDGGASIPVELNYITDARAAESESRVFDLKAEISTRENELFQHVKDTGRPFSELAVDEKADYVAEIYSLRTEIMVEQGQVYIDNNRAALDSARVIIDGHADSGDLDTSVIAADRDRLDGVSREVEAGRAQTDQHVERVQRVQQDEVDRIRAGESLADAKEHAMAAARLDIHAETRSDGQADGSGAHSAPADVGHGGVDASAPAHVDVGQSAE